TLRSTLSGMKWVCTSIRPGRPRPRHIARTRSRSPSPGICSAAFRLTAASLRGARPAGRGRSPVPPQQPLQPPDRVAVHAGHLDVLGVHPGAPGEERGQVGGVVVAEEAAVGGGEDAVHRGGGGGVPLGVAGPVLQREVAEQHGAAGRAEPLGLGGDPALLCVVRDDREHRDQQHRVEGAVAERQRQPGGVPQVQVGPCAPAARDERRRRVGADRAAVPGVGQPPQHPPVPAADVEDPRVGRQVLAEQPVGHRVGELLGRPRPLPVRRRHVRPSRRAPASGAAPRIPRKADVPRGAPFLGCPERTPQRNGSEPVAHRKAIPLIVSAAVGAAVCGPVPAAAGTAGGAGTVLEWRDCTVDDVAPDPFGGGGEMPEPPDGMRCADLEVPIDYDDPAGATVALQVARVPSTGGGDTGPPVLLAPGGPGGPGIADFAPWTGAADGLLDGADLVTWNPRGTGGETMEMLSPEECLMSGPEFTVPRTEEEYDAAVSANEEAFELCRSAAPELFANMDSATHARDMDAIRAALGEERLRHFGYSYGAVLDVSYARLFPQRVEAMFLDSAVSHVGDFETEESAFYRMMEEAFAEFAEWCAGADECVWQGEDVSAEWRALTAAAEEEPLPAGDGDLLLDGDDLRTAAAPMAKNAELWPVFSEAAGNALDGDASGFLNGPGGGRPYFSSSSQATECADGVRFGDYQGYRAALERGDELSPN